MNATRVMAALGQFNPIFLSTSTGERSVRTKPDNYFSLRTPNKYDRSTHIRGFNSHIDHPPSPEFVNGVLDSRFGSIPYSYRNKGGTKTVTLDFNGNQKRLSRVLEFIRLSIPEISLEYDEENSQKYLRESGLRGVTTLLMRTFDLGVSRSIPFMDFRVDGIFIDKTTGLMVEIGENTIIIHRPSLPNNGVNELFERFQSPSIDVE